MCDSDFIVIPQQEKELDALNTRIQQFDHSFREIVVALGMAGKFGGVDVDDHSVVEKVREVMQENARLKEGGK